MKSPVKEKTKKISGIMAVMMLFIMLFSAMFIVLHSDHDCTGEDCPVCACLALCQKTIKTMGNTNGTVACIATSVIPLLIVLSPVRLFLASDTLVSRKIRLND